MSGAMSRDRYDVVVAGGGPAGATVAAHLARRGVSVLMCDAARFPRHKICGEYLPPASAAVLERLGVMSQVEALRPLRPVGMAVVAPGGTTVLGRYGESSGRGLSIRRYDLDGTLLLHAARCGAEVREGIRVSGFDRIGSGRLLVHLAATNGGSRAVGGARTAPESVWSRALVGADGRNSVVARRLGLRLTERRHRRWAIMGHFGGVRAPLDHGEMIITPYGYCGINPLPGDLANVCIVVDPRRAGNRIPGRGELDSFFDATIAAVPATRERMLRAERAGALLAAGPLACRTGSSVADSALLVGDAAGFFDPFTGEGLHMALRGGEMAAEALGRALRRDDLSAKSLAPYEARRRATFAGRLRVDRFLQALLKSPQLTDFVARKLARDPMLADLLARVTGDLAGAAELLRPRFVARMLWA